MGWNEVKQSMKLEIEMKYYLDGDEIESSPIAKRLSKKPENQPYHFGLYLFRFNNNGMLKRKLIAVRAPPCWSERNIALFVHVLEHEFLHCAILELEGATVSAQLDNSGWTKSRNSEIVRYLDGIIDYNAYPPLMEQISTLVERMDPMRIELAQKALLHIGRKADETYDTP